MIKFSKASDPTLGPTQPPVEWLLGLKLPVREVDVLPLYSAELRIRACHLHGPICFHNVVFNILP